MNTNIIRFENTDRIRIQIFWYSNIIRIIFEYRIIRSPLFPENNQRQHQCQHHNQHQQQRQNQCNHQHKDHYEHQYMSITAGNVQVHKSKTRQRRPHRQNSHAGGTYQGAGGAFLCISAFPDFSNLTGLELKMDHLFSRLYSGEG